MFHLPSPWEEGGIPRKTETLLTEEEAHQAQFSTREIEEWWATAPHGARDGFQARQIPPEKAVILRPILPKPSPPVKNRLPSSPPHF